MGYPHRFLALARLLLVLPLLLGPPSRAQSLRDVAIEDLVHASSGRLAVYALHLPSGREISLNGSGLRSLSPLSPAIHAARWRRAAEGSGAAGSVSSLLSTDDLALRPSGWVPRSDLASSQESLLDHAFAEGDAASLAHLERLARNLATTRAVAADDPFPRDLRSREERAYEILAHYDPRLKSLPPPLANRYLLTGDASLLVPSYLPTDPLRNEDHVVRMRQAREWVRSSSRDHSSLKAAATWLESMTSSQEPADQEFLKALAQPAQLPAADLLPAWIEIEGLSFREDDQSTFLARLRAGEESVLIAVDCVGYAEEEQRTRFLRVLTEAATRRMMGGALHSSPEEVAPKVRRAYREGALRRDSTITMTLEGASEEATTFTAGQALSFVASVAPEDQDMVMTVRWLMPGCAPQTERRLARTRTLNRLRFPQTARGSGPGEVEVALDGQLLLRERFQVLQTSGDQPADSDRSRDRK